MSLFLSLCVSSAFGVLKTELACVRYEYMPIQCDGSNNRRYRVGGGSYDLRMHCENEMDRKRGRENSKISS